MRRPTISRKRGTGRHRAHNGFRFAQPTQGLWRHRGGGDTVDPGKPRRGLSARERGPARPATQRANPGSPIPAGGTERRRVPAMRGCHCPLQKLRPLHQSKSRLRPGPASFPRLPASRHLHGNPQRERPRDFWVLCGSRPGRQRARGSEAPRAAGADARTASLSALSAGARAAAQPLHRREPGAGGSYLGGRWRLSESVAVTTVTLSALAW